MRLRDKSRDLTIIVCYKNLNSIRINDYKIWVVIRTNSKSIFFFLRLNLNALVAHTGGVKGYVIISKTSDVQTYE